MSSIFPKPKPSGGNDADGDTRSPEDGDMTPLSAFNCFLKAFLRLGLSQGGIRGRWTLGFRWQLDLLGGHKKAEQLPEMVTKLLIP